MYLQARRSVQPYLNSARLNAFCRSIKQSWLESGSVYGYRKVARDLRDLGERCGKHRVARLMRGEGLRAQVGYRRRPGMRGGKPAVVAANHLARQFDPVAANRAWVTDITYIRTHEGWLYLAAVMDLYSRRIVGWAMGSTMHTDLVLQASLRSGNAIHRARLAGLPESPRSGQQHEPARQLP